jgi:O-acetyl-ADP-ribose deacetylase (regulator of RNase III)
MDVTAELGDITTVEADAIVNAANSSLLGGGGVDGAIHRAAGPELLAACQELRSSTLDHGLPVGDAVVTPGFRLPARWVVHTVGPNRHAGETDPELLASCFRRSLDVASDVHAKSVAFPAVSAGVYGWDAADVAHIAVATVREWAQATHDHAGVERVRFVLFSEALLAAFEEPLAAPS